MIDLLRLLSSEQEQLNYETDVTIANVPAEFLCMSFDDQYHSDDSFFRSSFTADELEALAEFHRYCDKHSRVLPEARGTVQTWLAFPDWRGIMFEAKKILDGIAPDPR
ncbi:MAG: hypothetical protein OEW13_03825 [Nitrospira sp.]|nr:hypothetical protein [Nitrospira sp.]